ncbi:MAG: DNA cytosine methyltransferase, partial [Acidaminococcaceae bacterium]|nr:DNA cytosine methyltransferase [Acidaminococcaceae bacterium]
KYMLNRIDLAMPYSTEKENNYQQLMRTWYEDDVETVTGNCFRKTVRDFPIFECMKQGDGYIQASQIADMLLEKACSSRNILPVEGNPEYEKLKKSIVPPYDRENFLNKWQKLCLDKPSHTLVAHLSVDTYSHIHPYEPRGISVREAARLQSFPDGFIFQCNMGEAFKQIGNAVPPLLAKNVALQLYKTFNKEK